MKKKKSNSTLIIMIKFEHLYARLHEIFNDILSKDISRSGIAFEKIVPNLAHGCSSIDKTQEVRP